MFRTYLPIDYLAIDIANSFGNDNAVGFTGDKALFEERIQWVKNNYAVLEQRADEAEEKELYIKGVMALRDIEAGRPTGHMVMLDAACSGIQVMSAITGCLRGGDITGQIDPDKRPDAYTIITDYMNQLLADSPSGKLKVLRSDAKDAVMTAGYGSKRTPLIIFGDALIDTFYESCHEKAPGAFMLLDVLIGAWQSYALQHAWELPDGHVSFVKVMEVIETDIEIDELNHHRFSTKYKKNRGSKSGVSLAANVTHSIDSYLLRTVLRRTNYNPRRIRRNLNILKRELAKTTRTPIGKVDRFNMAEREERFNGTAMADTFSIECVNKYNVGYMSKNHIAKLIDIAERMLQFKPFHTLTVHDAFRCSPAHCNTLRYWYKEVLAELSESTILQDILTQITHSPVQINKLSSNMAEKIRNSNYTLG